MLRFSIVTLLLLAGCGGTPDTPPPDVRFDPRDAVIDPRDGDATDRGPDSGDAPNVVDVMVYDLADATVAPEASVDAAHDGSAPFDRPLLEDAPATPCSELAEQYAAAVREASTCATASECGARVCETLCCVCQVFVSGLGDRVRRLDELRSRAEGLGCSALLGCSTTRCEPPRTGLCSSAGRCVTLREASDGGGRDP